jgi:ABC-type transport system involved in multi-copper enzyme maturation permease subunit
MLCPIFVIAPQEIKSLVKEKTFLLILGIFFAMTLFSVYIGWSTKHTIEGVYQVSVASMIQQGVKSIPLDPFAQIPVLSIYSNMIVYIFLIGSLLSIIVGYNAFMRDRKAGVAKILFAKPLTKNQLIAGKILGIASLLGIIVFISFLISFTSSFVIPNQHLGLMEIGKLLTFYLLSYVYLLIFAFIGLFFAVSAKNESIALLNPIVVWIVISFMLPELTSALGPTASLNPININQATPQGTFFTLTNQFIRPFSISQHFKLMSSGLLGVQNQSAGLTVNEIITRNISGLIPLVLFLVITIYGCMRAIKRYEVTNDLIDE